MKMLKMVVFLTLLSSVMALGGCAEVAEGLMVGIAEGLDINNKISLLDPFTETKTGPETTVNKIQSFPGKRKVVLSSPVAVEKGMKIEKNDLSATEKDVMKQLHNGIKNGLSANNVLANGTSGDVLKVEISVHYIVKNARPSQIAQEYYFPSLYGSKKVKRVVGGQVLITRLIMKYKGAPVAVLDSIDSTGTGSKYQELTDPMSSDLVNELSKLVDKGVTIRKTPLPFAS